jgi:DNA-binding MarR family transcriptional regulator
VSHPSEALNDVVHQRTRLGILAVLAEADRAQFTFLKDTLGLTDGNLSRHLTILEEATYVAIEKGYEGKRPRTWVTITKSGRAAFASELALLKSLLRPFEGSATGRAKSRKAKGVSRPSALGAT